MSAKRRPASRRPKSLSPRHRDLEARLDRVFLKVRQLVSQVDPKLETVKLLPACREIQFQRRKKGFTGYRSFMHVGHARGGAICAIRNAAALSDSHLVGLFLHEFGHLAGGDSEPAANDWVKYNLDVDIEYRGPLDLQWVSPEVVRRVLG